jgi:hypothetical protein
MTWGAAAGALASLGRLRWETPYRWAASVVGIALVAPALGAAGGRPLEVLSRWAASAGAASAADHLAAADVWLVGHAGGEAVAALCLLVVIAAVAAGRTSREVGETRAAPTVILCVAVGQYAGGRQGLLVGVWLASVLAFAVEQKARARARPSAVELSMLHVVDLLVAIVHLPASILVWCIGPSGRREAADAAAARRVAATEGPPGAQPGRLPPAPA